MEARRIDRDLGGDFHGLLALRLRLWRVCGTDQAFWFPEVASGNLLSRGVGAFVWSTGAQVRKKLPDLGEDEAVLQKSFVWHENVELSSVGGGGYPVYIT